MKGVHKVQQIGSLWQRPGSRVDQKTKTTNKLVDPPSRLGAFGKGWEGGSTKKNLGRPPPPDLLLKLSFTNFGMYKTYCKLEHAGITV